MQSSRSPLRVAIRQDPGQRTAVADVEVSRHNALGVRLPDDTMFACNGCGKTFNSHSPLAEHVSKSKSHRAMTWKEHFNHQCAEDFTPCFSCLCCETSVPLNPSQLFDHLKTETHVHKSLDQVLSWYKNQPYGLSKEPSKIEERHHRGIDKLLAALSDVYYFDLA